MTSPIAASTATATADPDAPLDPLSEAALEWLVRLHDGTAQDTDWANYDRWQSASLERQAAARRAEALWESVGPALQRPKRGRTTMIALLVAGCLAALVGIGTPQGWLADARTGSGEQRRIALADGSQLLLDAATSVDIDITADHRRLTLHRGTLHVAVAPDTTRPFEVIAADGRIRALGTAFDVQRQGSDVQVLVTEHAVHVTQGAASRAVQSGQSLQYGSRGLGASIQASDLRSQTAWQRGRLVFDGKPLGDVVAEMQRYRPGLIVISDERLRALPVTGVFETGDGEALVEAVAAILPVRVTRLPWLAVIRPADPH